MQEDVGIQGVTDGEFGRTLWHADFLSQIEGVNVVEGLSPESSRE
jgi:5-methyltetrahydropteroyltriglutamate--homocysteine methyltransferase